MVTLEAHWVLKEALRCVTRTWKPDGCNSTERGPPHVSQRIAPWRQSCNNFIAFLFSSHSIGAQSTMPNGSEISNSTGPDPALEGEAGLTSLVVSSREYLFLVAEMVFMLVILVGNGLTITAICTTPSLQTNTYRSVFVGVMRARVTRSKFGWAHTRRLQRVFDLQIRVFRTFVDLRNVPPSKFCQSQQCKEFFCLLPQKQCAPCFSKPSPQNQ